ncbi:dihydrofolate synthase/folylpolyglutamate synthase [Mesocricetibacter intestinalis]|uniref:Dihydrofolate synthase/folylpolyglutamate synthase n=1 Tax=Mesocricetibacter intestinalis TaxID=1521930 RepID=A0A4R6VAQ4_9PAST|nr:bifunctional tetrahydrofolate synthase/dihydrofolate synthase [Mesocricetibacter intestinalis]TDQ59037.1 dihydrofolate synthase/folylpolyglutamate synthase [Mesocricetibacter intestinalis]
MKHHLTAASSLQDWLSYLENAHYKSIDMGLERVKSVARALDLLDPAPFVISVGGTNGKGTTCRLLETLLLNAGYRVGVYSSPHLLHYNERVRIQNQELADEKHTASFAFIEANKTASLSYFEFSTLSALHLFKQAQLDVVILEVGLGGRLDATNIVDNHIAVITSIDIDHTEFLGHSREAIGYEKAGIFRPAKVAVIGEPDIPVSMLEYAAHLNCRCYCRGRDWGFESQSNSWHWFGKNLQRENLPLCAIPLANAATALAVLEHLPFNISPRVIEDSLRQVRLTGRFQQIEAERLSALSAELGRNPKDLARIIADVGHNPHAARYLSEKLKALKEATSSGRIIAVCGILKDKDAEGIISPLLALVDCWYCVSLTGPRGRTGEELSTVLHPLVHKQPHNIEVKSKDSVRQGVLAAIEEADERDILIIFGSFYTVAEFLQLL